ncbi:peptidoglycan-binding protein [Actinomadura sp. WMMB 499]|uniref:peptidoglycan-binding protein n=1 Tax=Actinomadura sp. WMMB 499 TaxID=1219491 RepID=UPI001246B79C|nr:peptidoglycan-binding protein [Actinomadura sp. WMMB 499]QFG25440.1 CHAP domain-containing protein [Actinomadura sp. WMMB 499]
MGTANGLIDRAEKDINLGEPNYLQRSYSKRVGWAYYNYAWCQAAINEWAHDTGNHKAVMFGVNDAYTVTAARRFEQHGRWFKGTYANVLKAKPGDIVFFDWGKTDSIDHIDHVGVVTDNLGNGRLRTIEGNTENQCLRRTRSYVEIAGFGRPAYDGQPAPSVPTYPGVEAPKWPGRYITQPPLMEGSDVRRWQSRMRARGWSISVDGWYGPDSERICRQFQAEKGLGVDGVVGPKTWKASWEAPVT